MALSITDGRTVRDLFCNGLLRYLTEAGCVVTVFTEAAHVKRFVEAWRQPGVTFKPFAPVSLDRARHWAFRLRRTLMRGPSGALVDAYMGLERKWLYAPGKDHLDSFRSARPQLFFATNVHLLNEAGLVSAARALGIPTLGLVQSWDNVYKGLQCRTDALVVWNEVNRQEVLNFDHYTPDAVTAIGAPQFDPYFQEGTRWSREELAARFDLDPARPILLFASLGYFIPGFDETCWMDELLSLIERGDIQGRPQVICRLHPWSRYEHFKQYAVHPDVRLSYVDRYYPALTWYMTRDDVVEVGHMLRHADVVITPGSTITLEAALFDTPTLVPIFHPYQPDRARDYFSRIVLAKHFQRIERDKLVPILREASEYGPAINTYLEDPSLHRAERAQLVRDYAYYTDGRAVERLAKRILELAQ